MRSASVEFHRGRVARTFPLIQPVRDANGFAAVLNGLHAFPRLICVIRMVTMGGRPGGFSSP